MNRENRPLVTDELVELVNKPVQVQDFRKIINCFRGIHRMYFELMKRNHKMSTCNGLDLETLTSRPIMSQNFLRPKLGTQRRGSLLFYLCIYLFSGVCQLGRHMEVLYQHPLETTHCKRMTKVGAPQTMTMSKTNNLEILHDKYMSIFENVHPVNIRPPYANTVFTSKYCIYFNIIEKTCNTHGPSSFLHESHCFWFIQLPHVCQIPQLRSLRNSYLNTTTMVLRVLLVLFLF